MRADMAKVITERPRVKGSSKVKGEKREWSRIPDEDKPHKERGGVRFKWKKDWNIHKEFGELLGPLKRYALSCVGRKWNDVYSEVCQHIDKGSVTQNHILTHLYHYIARNCFMKYGAVYHNEAPFYQVYGAVVYVDAETGIIKRVPDHPRRKRKQEEDGLVKIAEDHYYIRNKQTGIWYECWMKPTPEPYYENYLDSYLKNRVLKRTVYPKVYDTFLKETTRGGVIYAYDRQPYPTNLYCYKKRQLNKREIRRLLKN